MLNNKFLQRFLAITPLVLLILIVFGYFIWIFSMTSKLDFMTNTEKSFDSFVGFRAFMISLFLTLVLCFFDLIYFIFHVIYNPNLEQNNNRLIWILVIALVGILGCFIYWIAEIEAKKSKPVIS